MAAALAALFSTSAVAQFHCGKLSDMLGKLESRFAESPVGMGIATNGNTVILLTNPETGPWTILGAYPSGIACGVASGEHWEKIEPKKVKSGAAS